MAFLRSVATFTTPARLLGLFTYYLLYKDTGPETDMGVGFWRHGCRLWTVLEFFRLLVRVEWGYSFKRAMFRTKITSERFR